MRPLFGAEGCAVNEAGISTAGNPLARVFDAAAGDPLHARQLRQAQLGPRGPMAMGPRGALLDPMMAKSSGGLEAAWQEVGPAARPMGPGMLGAAMHDQFAQHMQAPMRPRDPGFFMEGPVGPMNAPGVGSDWAAEFAGGPGPRGLQMAHAPLRPPGADWAAEFAPPPPAMAMEAAFHEAREMEARQAMAAQRMEAAFVAETQRQAVLHREMETAWVEAAPPAASFIDQVPGMQFQEDKSAPAKFEDLEEAWGQTAARAELEEAWGAAGEEMEEIWSGATQAAMEDLWRMEGEGLEQAWLGQGLEQAWANAGGDYAFAKENAYLESSDPLAEAQRLLREGRDREALLALEAEVQRNPESSEGWRQLGQLYAELDQDVEAIQCLKRGHEVDPYNLDSLLALGVSCTNELDQLPALKYLRRWVENHEEHSVFVQGMEVPPEYDYEGWRRQVTALFNEAAAANPLDADVFTALGVMENINRNYEGAIRALATACRLRPNDHTVWNKLGATLANSGRSEQAVVAYHQGLTLKPNYARSWSNLAIAHASLGQHADAARFYLSSLVLNPEATHIWNFLHSAVLNMNGVNAFEAIDRRDLEACTKLIDGVLDPLTLPKPTAELPEPPDQVLGAIGL